jgi:hypothetical protein
MRFLLRIVPPRGENAEFLAIVRSVASNLGVQARNPKWTSYGALEIDLFARSKGDFELCLSALEPLGRIEYFKDLNEAPPYRSIDEAVAEARRLFNSERYWESHEVLEGVWRTLEGEERLFVQGIILVCASFVHHQKREEKVALGVLRRAQKQLQYGRKDYHGIRVESFQVSDLCLQRCLWLG